MTFYEGIHKFPMKMLPFMFKRFNCEYNSLSLRVYNLMTSMVEQKLSALYTSS